MLNISVVSLYGLSLVFVLEWSLSFCFNMLVLFSLLRNIGTMAENLFACN